MCLSRRPFLRAFISLVLFCTPFFASAQGSAGSTISAALDDFIRTQTRSLPGKVTYTLGPVNNARPCSAYEPFLPPGNRLWGKSTVGVRCLSPSPWTIYLQVSVSVTGNYLVSARNLPTGTLVSSNDIAYRSGELTVLPASILTDASQAIGKTVRNSVAVGQYFRSDALIAPWTILQGQTVRMVSKGTGFRVSSEGRALNNANEGQIVQVRAASGQVVSGFARAGGIVEIAH
ncbi:MAG: flagellar basal body P-ring formation protein FlgA [Candidatus Accumulibacter sp.]|nr:flagellar basal body P-ring formation protein FlgA [Accumulibacter sp.]